MGRRTKEEKLRSRGTLNTGLPSLNREVNTFPIYLPLKSCLFCHHLVKLLYLGRKRHPCRNPGVTSMRTSQHPAQASTSFQSRDSTHPKINLSSHSGGQLCLWCSHHWVSVSPVALGIPSGHLLRRVAGSWPECQWCPSLPGSAGHLGHASSSADPCKDLESKGSNVSQLWSAEQAWKWPKKDTEKSRTKDLLHKSFTASSNNHCLPLESIKN